MDMTPNEVFPMGGSTGDDEALIQSGEAARRLDISKSWLRRMVRDGMLTLADETEQGAWLFRASDIDRLAEERRRAGLVPRRARAVWTGEDPGTHLDDIAAFVYAAAFRILAGQDRQAVRAWLSERAEIALDRALEAALVREREARPSAEATRTPRHESGGIGSEPEPPGGA
jgi:hypothetical protein